MPRIEVAFDIDENGILTVSARDLGTGRQQSINVSPASGLNEAEISKIMDDAVAASEDDRVRKELALARNKAASLLYTSERALTEFGEVLSPAEREALEQDLAECRRAVEAGELSEVLEALVRLETSAQRIGEIIYAQADPEGTS